MGRDIYEMLNDAKFDPNEFNIEENEKEVINDLEKKKIKKNILKGRKRNYKKLITISTSVALILLIILCNQDIRNDLKISLKQVLSKFDLINDSELDNNAELDEVNKDGIEIKIQEVYRDSTEVKITYSMTFEDGIPESIKDIEKGNDKELSKEDSEKILALKDELFEMEKNISESFPSNSRNENKKILNKDENYVKKSKELNTKMIKHKLECYEGFDIKANGITIIDADINDETCRQTNISSWSVINKEIKDNTIVKEATINLESSSFENDINIEVYYNNIKLDNGDVKKGNWSVKCTIKPGKDDVIRIALDTICETSNNEKYIIESYSYKDNTLRIYGVHDSYSHEKVIRLEGYDDLGNKLIIYSRYPEYVDNSRYDNFIFEISDETPEIINNGEKSKLVEGVKSLTFQAYEREDKQGTIYWIPIGDKFTVNLAD